MSIVDFPAFVSLKIFHVLKESSLFILITESGNKKPTSLTLICVAISKALIYVKNKLK